MNDKRIVLTVVAGLALAGVFLMLLSTPHGVGVLPDSTVYFEAARNLMHGSGLQALSGSSGALVPLTHYPPLFSGCLALIAGRGPSVESTARILNAILFGGNIFLSGFTISRYARDSFWLPLLGAFVTLTAVDIAAGHSFALAEPLFIFLTFIALLLLAQYLGKLQRFCLLAAALATALGVLTRYVGAATVITGCVVLLFETRNFPGAQTSTGADFNRRNLRRRVLDSFLFGTIASLPLLLWVLSGRSVLAGAGDREFAFHPIHLQQVGSAFSTVAQWLWLGKVSGGLRVAGFIIGIVTSGVLAVCLRSGDRAPLPVKSEGRAILPILIAFIVVYIAFLVFTAAFVDADTVFDSRSLLPVHFAAIVLCVCLGQDLYARSQIRYAKILMMLLTVLLLGSQAFRLAGWFQRTRVDGQGYAGRVWQNSETIAAVKAAVPDLPIYSNGYDAIHYLTGQPARLIPEKIVHGTGRVNLNYDKQVEEMRHDLKERHGMLVYLHNLNERTYLPSEDELRTRLSPQVRTFNDGSIFEILTK